ncbi:DUF6333 family protein [Nonomuraea sp. NPDC052129]|uniref:DUF6333 family protein n=1 Tax=Nonomuraea sp. NPDC052129 TaxID=3154651 RepID=UPI00341D9E6B
MIHSPLDHDEYDQLSDSDGVIRVRDSRTELTIVAPGADLAAVIAGTAAHDPAQALRIVTTLDSVAEVAEVLEPLPLSDCTLMPYEPADLDLVVVGCWGGVIYVSEPGLAGDLTDFAELEVLNQRRLHPEARIVSSVFLDMVADLAEVIIALPGVEPVREFNDSEEIRVEGDLSALLHALGCGEASDLDFEDFRRRALGFASHDAGPERLLASTFRVRRPEDIVWGMEDVWIRQ